MNIKRIIILALVGVVTFLAGYFIGKERADKPPGTVTETRETYIDTIIYRVPVPQSEIVLGTTPYKMPLYRFISGYAHQQNENESLTEETDTLTYQMYGTGAGGEPRCCGDSATVVLPKIQRHYSDSTYDAWVSGPIDPNLDSLKVYAPTTVITQREWRPPRRWHIGLSAGYGITPRGAQPYLGLSLTYSILSF